MTKCSAPNCINSQKTSEFNFYEFPEDSHLHSKWITNIGRPNWTPGRRSMICSAHFEKTQFKTTGRFQLIEGAVPTIFQSSRKKRGAQIQKDNSLCRKRNPDIDSSNIVEENKNDDQHLNGLDKNEEVKSRNESTSYALETGKFVTEMVLIDGTYILEDCEIGQNKQSSNLLRCITSNIERRIPSPNNCLPQMENSVLLEDRSPQTEDNVIIVQATAATGNATSDFVLVDETCQSKSKAVILLQNPPKDPNEACKAPFNLSEIATPYSSTLSATCDSDVYVELNAAIQNHIEPPIKRSKLQEEDCGFPLFEKHHIEADTSKDYDELNLGMSESSINKGVVDLPISLSYHEWGKHARKAGSGSSLWQTGTFMCRLCGVASNKTVNMFSTEATEIKLLERITSILPIMIVQSDELPQNVCSKCLGRLDACSELVVTSFNTHRQLASVMGQDLNQSSQLSIFFHERKKSITKPDCKRHLLLMEMFYDEGKPPEEYLSIALEDLKSRLHPQTKNSTELQCSLLLASISNKSMVSQLEQAKTAAEALVSMGLIQTERIQPSPTFGLDKENTAKSFLLQNDILIEEATQAELNDLKVIESLQLTEPPDSFEAESDAQAMPVTDDVSPSHYFSTGIRYPRLQKGWKDTEAFKTFQTLLHWKLEGDEVKLTCRICDYVSDKNCSIKNHLKEHLSSSLDFQNKVDISVHCEKAEASEQGSRDTLKSWVKKQFHTRYQCSFCSERLDSKQNLKNHLQVYHAANTKCESCGHNAVDVCEAILHCQTCNEARKVREWECRKCLEIFSGEEELKKHQAHSGHVEIGDVGSKSLPQKARFNQLRKSQFLTDFKCFHQCPHCPKRYINSSRLKEHMQKHDEKKYMCKVCGKLFSTKQILRQHEFTHGDPQYLCSLCSRTFYRKSHLLKHMNVHNPDNARASRAGPQPHRDGLNRCRECKNVFEQKDLLLHYKSSHPHIQLQSYTCEICKEENTSYAELFQHQREVHKTGVKDCPFCEKTIDSSTQMKYHLMKHEGMYPYNCPMCNNGYTANSVLQDHIRRKHTGEKPFECQQCSKRFPTNGALAQHSTVHSLPHQLLPCPVCNIGFKRKAHLDVHLRTHTGEKPYPCPICDRPFRQRPDCVKHVRVIHGEDPTKYEFRYHPNMSITFPQVVSVSDMELVLEGEDLMQASLEASQLATSH